MTELPSSTVTLLFTDIEGSTELLKELGGDYERVLSDHRNLLRRAFNLNGGQVVDRQGDAFFVVFRRARDAVAAAVEAQRGLAAHPWPEGHEPRVRMGLHTGEPAIGEEGLTGLAVHRAARICAAAHGGQILVSNTTREVIGDEGAVVRDVGEYTLKGFDRPERLFEVVAEASAEAFAPPSPDAGPTAPGMRSDELTASSESAASDSRTRFARFTAHRPRDILSGRFRRRWRKAPIDHLGSRIYSMARLSPSPELASALRALGGAVVQIAREDRRAEQLLRSLDRRATAHRLSELREAAFISDEDAHVADALARRIDGLQRLEELRSILAREVARIDARVHEIRQDIFSARLGHELPPGLAAEVDATCDAVQTLSRRLREAEELAERPLRAARPTTTVADKSSLSGVTGGPESLAHLTDAEMYKQEPGRDDGHARR